MGAECSIPILTVANLSGNSNKEIVRVTSDSGSATITGLDLNGQTILERNFSTSMLRAERWTAGIETLLRVADLNGDGYDEILVVRTGQILRAAGTVQGAFLTGFATEGDYRDADFALEGTTYNVVLGDGANVYVKALDGTTRTGWPIAGSHFEVGRENGSDDKVVIYSDRLKTYNLDGSLASRP